MNRQFATFRLGEALFGVDVLLVDEINRQLDVMPVAGAPDYVRGLLNLRGQIVTVIDLGAKIGAGAVPITAQSRCVVLKSSRMIARFRETGQLEDDTSPDMVGLLVSRVEDMVAVEQADIDPAPANIGEMAGKYIAGVVQMEGELLNLLKVREIVALEDAEHARA